MEDTSGSVVILTPELRVEFEKLFNEFAGIYLTGSKGERHIKLSAQSRKQARDNIEIVQKAQISGKDITDLVLEKLLNSVFMHLI